MAQQILSQIWREVNETLEIDCGRFNPRHFCTRGWYLTIVQMLLPQLQKQWTRIQKQITQQQIAIDQILKLLVQQGVIGQQFIQEIHGQDIVNGQFQSVHQMAQLMKQMVLQAIQENSQQAESPQKHPQQLVDPRIFSQQQSPNSKLDNKKEVIKQKMPFNSMSRQQNNKRVTSDPSESRNIKSVQAIDNQFEQEQQSNLNEYNINGKGHNQKNQKETMIFNSKSIDPNYISDQLKKVKSQKKFNTKVSNNFKPKKKENVQVLVTHPKIKKKYIKAKNNIQKQLTNDVKKTIEGVRSQKNINKKQKKPAGIQLVEKKKRELNYITNNPQRKILRQNKLKSPQKNIQKLLKWRQNNFKRQQIAIQQGMQINLQMKRQKYLKKVNKLITELQKQKLRQQRKLRKQKQIKQRQLVQQRLEAIQNQHKNKVNLLKQAKNNSKKQLMHIDHRVILNQLEKQLKKQNQQRQKSLQLRLKREEVALQEDFQNLQKQIIHIYKKT